MASSGITPLHPHAPTHQTAVVCLRFCSGERVQLGTLVQCKQRASLLLWVGEAPASEHGASRLELHTSLHLCHTVAYKEQHLRA